MLLARDDGEVVGHGLAQRSDSAGAGSVIPRVLPEHRRRGVGTALLERLADHVAGLGLTTVRGTADDDGALAFAHRFGFARSTARSSRPTPSPDRPTSRRCPTASRWSPRGSDPACGQRAYERFGREALAGFAVDTPLDVSPSSGGRATGWATRCSSLCTTARSSAAPGLDRDSDSPSRAENGLTAVRRDWRGRGLAVHLKQRDAGVGRRPRGREVYTWTQDGNAAMRALNTRLGYATTRTGIQLARRCPWTGRRLTTATTARLASRRWPASCAPRSPSPPSSALALRL